jgi:hypothetical protein
LIPSLLSGILNTVNSELVLSAGPWSV